MADQLKYFFTADPHYGHANIILYCQRPFMDLKDYERMQMAVELVPPEERAAVQGQMEAMLAQGMERMNTRLVHNCNERVKPGYYLYIVGDLCFKNSSAKRGEGVPLRWDHWLNQLNGHKVLFKGNHDRNNSARTLLHTAYLDYAGLRIGVTHQPSDVVLDTADFWIVGHVHNNWQYKLHWQAGLRGRPIMINCGVDVWDYRPVEISEIVDLYRKIKHNVVTILTTTEKEVTDDRHQVSHLPGTGLLDSGPGASPAGCD